MHIEEDVSSFIEKIPTSKECCFCIPLKSGSKTIAILGILIGLTCAAMLLLKDRKYLTASSIILISLLSIFILVTLLFVIASVMLLIAVFDENPELISYYIWLAGFYLCVQLILAIAIPMMIIIDGKYPVAVALIWMVGVMVITLGWAHFISVVNTYRMFLIYGGNV